MAEPENKREEQSWRPVPDPTELTTAALYREVSALKELMELRFQANDRELLLAKTVVETRFDGMDRALKLLQDISDRFPDRIDEKIGSLKEIHGGLFVAVQGQFVERDVRTDKLSEANKLAVDAALQAAEKAVNKQAESFLLASAETKATFVKQIDQLAELLTANTRSLDEKINDAKDRLNRIEGQAVGHLDTKAETHASASFVVTLISLVLAVLMGLLAASAYIRPGH